jgi:prepilin-type N-terminal cleavage/methylation domain-containing protein
MAMMKMKIKFFHNKKNGDKGFTLVELLIAISLFSVIVAVAVGGFSGMLRTQREISSLLTADSNVSLAIEQMAREMRTGSEFCVPGSTGTSLCDCPQQDTVTGALSCNNIAFTNAEGQAVIYALQGGVLEKSIDGGATYGPVTATNVSIPYFNVLVLGNTPGDHWSPRLTIRIGVTSKDSALVGQGLRLQTSVSSRNIDCDAAGTC